jgi:hypothetical protein
LNGVSFLTDGIKSRCGACIFRLIDQELRGGRGEEMDDGGRELDEKER